MKIDHNLLAFCKKLIRITKAIKKKNIICVGIDPGVNLGISVFAIENINNPNISIKCIYGIQKNFIKDFDYLEHDKRILAINNFIYELLLKYQVSLVALEQANYSSGKFSYSENLLARYTGSIYITTRTLGIKVIAISYKLMQKLVIEKSRLKKDKEAIIDKISDIYPINIKKQEHDKLDALGYGYAVYMCLKLYYQTIIN